MPLYEYECKTCGHRFEELVTGTDAKAPACPLCGSDHVRRCLSAACVRAGGMHPAGARLSAGGCDTSGFS